jgi:hypothetical protein
MTMTEETAVAQSISALLTAEKHRYLDARKQKGGTAEGFRDRIRRQYSADPLKFNALMLDALMEAATRKWQQQPRKRGPDLFSIGGIIIPEILTRPSASFVTGQEIEEDSDEELFEKVNQRFATANDLREDWMIKARKVAQAGAAAERLARAFDVAIGRARGNMAAFLSDLKDDDMARQQAAE